MVVSAVTTVSAASSGEDSRFRVDLDSHADTCCVGNGVLIVNQTERTVRVTPFLKSLGSVNKVPIVTAAIAYDDPKTGEVFVLVVHQAMHFSEMNNCLLSPMQLRLNDVKVNERPKFLMAKPTEKDHAIIAGELLIPLDLHGITSFFHGRRPTMKEYEECERIELTYPDPQWSPHDGVYAEEEALQQDLDGTDRVNYRRIWAIHDEENFERDLSEGLRVASLTSQDLEIAALSSDNPRYKLTPEALSKTWGVGITVATRTLEATTQRAVRTVVNPSVER